MSYLLGVALKSLMEQPIQDSFPTGIIILAEVFIIMHIQKTYLLKNLQSYA